MYYPMSGGGPLPRRRLAHGLIGKPGGGGGGGQYHHQDGYI